MQQIQANQKKEVSERDMRVITNRNRAWANRPIRSFEMFGKTDSERIDLKEAKNANNALLNTHKGKLQLQGVQKHITKLEMKYPVKFLPVNI